MRPSTGRTGPLVALAVILLLGGGLLSLPSSGPRANAPSITDQLGLPVASPCVAAPSTQDTPLPGSSPSDSKSSATTLQECLSLQKARLVLYSQATTAYRVNLLSRVRAVGSHFLVFPHESTEYAFPANNLQPVVAGSTGFDPLQDKILTAVLQEGCSSGSEAGSSVREPALMLDVGAHVGIWSMLGLALGCRVIALEPYKESACYLQLGAQLNGWERRLTLHNKLCSDVDGVIFNGWNGCVGDKACSKHAVSAGPATLFAQDSVKVDDVVAEDVLILKMDIEGFEPHGLASARKLFARHRVSFVLIEVTWRINFEPVDGVREFLVWFDEMSYRAYWSRYEHQLFPVPLLAWYDRIWNSTEFCPPTWSFCQSNLLFAHPEQPLPLEVEALVRNNGNVEFSSMIPLP